MTIGCAQQRASVVYIGLGRQELSSRRQIHCFLMTFGCTRKRSGVFCTSFGCTRNLFGCPCDNFAEVLHTFGCHPPLGLYNNKPKRGRRTRQWLNDLAARAQHCTGCPWAKWATFTTGMSTKKLERPFRAPFRGGLFFEFHFFMYSTALSHFGTSCGPTHGADNGAEDGARNGATNGGGTQWVTHGRQHGQRHG